MKTFQLSSTPLLSRCCLGNIDCWGKPASFHCMVCTQFPSATAYLLWTIMLYCRRNNSLAVSNCSISWSSLLALGYCIPTLSCLMKFSSIRCLCLHVCILTSSCVLKSVAQSCFIACLDSYVIRDNCSHALLDPLGGTGTPASAGQPHPRVFWERQDGEKWQLISLCKWITAV